MIELCNATESGMLIRGAYNFEIEENGEGFYFTYKMVEGGFIVGDLNIEHKEKIYAVWNSEEYHNYTKLILLSDDKTKGTLSFTQDGFYLQVPFTVSSLSLDRGKYAGTLDVYERESLQKRTEEINDYYHEELEKALSIMYRLEEVELKYGVKLPKHLEKDIYDFTEHFRFRYADRELNGKNE